MVDPSPDGVQVPEFISFEERLDNSLQRDLTKIEHVRMRISHEPINSDLVDMELIELKFIFDRCASFLVWSDLSFNPETSLRSPSR